MYFLLDQNFDSTFLAFTPKTLFKWMVKVHLSYHVSQLAEVFINEVLLTLHKLFTRLHSQVRGVGEDQVRDLIQVRLNL